ncbi:MAG: hypothetical protein QG568_379, partial [Patescibacteria group bacterium]|nr:hypothetical protein [Patescibacteria group bacterium]
MFGFFIGVVVFIYLVGRIGRLEEQGKKLREELTSVESFLNSASPEDNKFIKENRQKDLRILRGESVAEESPIGANTNSPVMASPLTVASIADAAHSVAHSIPESVASSVVTSTSTSSTITSTKEDDQNAEFAIGSKLITSVGLVAVFLGVVFFLRYAFENNLISPSMRIFLGVLFGVVFIGIGHFLREKYETYSTSLIGGGLGIFYISAYAAYSFYELISEPAAFLLFLCITGFGVILSLLYNSKPLIQFSLLGGFIVPLIFPLAHSVHAIFPYLIILNLSILLIARFKVWPDLTALGLVSTALLCIQWTVSNRAETALTETFVYLTILFGIYFTTSFINFIVRDRDYKGVDAFLLYALPMLFFVWCAPLIDTK